MAQHQLLLSSTSASRFCAVLEGYIFEIPKGVSFVKLWSRNLEILKSVSGKWKLKGSSCGIKNRDISKTIHVTTHHNTRHPKYCPSFMQLQKEDSVHADRTYQTDFACLTPKFMPVTCRKRQKWIHAGKTESSAGYLKAGHEQCAASTTEIVWLAETSGTEILVLGKGTDQRALVCSTEDIFTNKHYHNCWEQQELPTQDCTSFGVVYIYHHWKEVTCCEISQWGCACSVACLPRLKEEPPVAVKHLTSRVLEPNQHSQQSKYWGWRVSHVIFSVHTLRQAHIC